MSFSQNTSGYTKYRTLHNQSLIKVCTAPEARFMPNGDPITTFSTVFIEVYKSGEVQMFRETWVKITGFKAIAEAMRNLQKGEWVLVDTTVPGLDKWTNQDGTQGVGMSMSLRSFPRRVQLVSSNPQAAGSGNPNPAGQASEEQPPEDDIPF